MHAAMSINCKEISSQTIIIISAQIEKKRSMKTTILDMKHSIKTAYLTLWRAQFMPLLILTVGILRSQASSAWVQVIQVITPMALSILFFILIRINSHFQDQLAS
jgi:uncharacterized membrane protein YoaK (UPF0700 family)